MHFPEYFAKYNALIKLNAAQTALNTDQLICIQDPFEICNSLPGEVSTEYFQRFQTAIIHAATVCETIYKHPSYRKHLLASFLAKMLEPVEPMILMGTNESIRPISIEPMEPIEPAVKWSQTQIDHSPSPVDSSKIIDSNKFDIRGRKTVQINCHERDRSAIKVYLKRSGCIASENSIRKTWTRLCIDGIRQTLTDIFGCKVTVGNQLDATSSLSKTYDVSATCNVFYGRTAALPDFELEMRTTKALLESANKGAHAYYRDKLKMICNVWAHVEIMNTITIDFYDLCNARNSSSFNIFFSDFQARIHMLISAYLRMVNGIANSPIVEMQATTSYTVSSTTSQSSSSPLPVHNDKKIESLGMREADRSIIIYPVEDDLKVIREYLRRTQPMTIFGENSIAVKQEWFRNCVACIEHILKNVCAVQLTSCTANSGNQKEYCSVYNMTGNHDVFARRPEPQKNGGSIAHECWVTEQMIGDQRTNIGSHTGKSFNARVFIWSDDASAIIVNIINLHANQTHNPVTAIVQILTNRIQGYISNYLKSLKDRPVLANQNLIQVETVEVIRKPLKPNFPTVSQPIQPLINKPFQLIKPSSRASVRSPPLITSLKIQCESIESEMNILRQQLRNDPHRSIVNLNWFWSQATLTFITKVMQKIFRFTLKPVTHPIKLEESETSRVFQLTGFFDITFARGKLRKSSVYMLDDEVEKSRKVTKKFSKPLTGILHIWTDKDDFRRVHIDFYNMNPNNSMFNQFLRSRIRHYVTACFNTYANKELLDII